MNAQPRDRGWPRPGKYGNRCPGSPFNREDIVEVPLANPGSASVIGSFGLGQMPPSETSPGGRINFRGGDWSSYCYNGLICESDTRRGLYVWKVSAPGAGGAMIRLDHLNPQTAQLSLGG